MGRLLRRDHRLLRTSTGKLATGECGPPLEVCPTDCSACPSAMTFDLDIVGADWQYPAGSPTHSMEWGGPVQLSAIAQRSPINPCGWSQGAPGTATVSATLRRYLIATGALIDTFTAWSVSFSLNLECEPAWPGIDGQRWHLFWRLDLNSLHGSYPAGAGVPLVTGGRYIKAASPCPAGTYELFDASAVGQVHVVTPAEVMLA